MDEGGLGHDRNEVVDIDSDDERLMADIRKLDRDVAAFRATMMESDSDHEEMLDPLLRGRKRGRGAQTTTRRTRKRRKVGGGGGGGGTDSGPSQETKIALGQASDALMRRDLDEALHIVEEIIRVNGETHEAFLMLSTIHQERGQIGPAIMAMCLAAHLKPRDFHGWLTCAQFALSDDTEGSRDQNLEIAQLCYSAAIRANPKSLKARMGKANCALEAGRSSVAAAEFVKVLKKRPHNMHALRCLAEAAFDTRGARKYVEMAREFYEQAIVHVRAGGELQRGTFEWSDVTAYVEMCAFLEMYSDAALALRSLSRLMIGRQEEAFWDLFEDDREWDQDEERRREVEEYVPNKYPYGLYGPALPLDLRVKLAIYRLRLGHTEEAARHLEWIPLAGHQNATVHEYFEDSPFVIKELANQLFENKQIEQALGFYEFYERLLAGEADPEVLVHKGKCFLELQDQQTAEDLFIQALEADDDNIDARYELAQLYEAHQEKEEAFVLVNEALRLAHNLEEEDRFDKDWNMDAEESLNPTEAKALQKRRIRRKIMREKKAGRRPKRAKRQYLRRMVGGAKREMYEQNVAESFRTKYQKVQELRARIANGDLDAEEEWMAAAGDLVDDFRSFKEFYPWDKYLTFMGYGSFFKENVRKNEGQRASEPVQQDGGRTREGTRAATVAPQGQEELAAMAERLQKSKS